ncbi:MAG: hypothetical protein GX610_00280 [Rhodococcus sp.]|nr:hypothetical protein [Rhodococcus sp. (in: high G+C Gram-positive bacteria)]
MEFVVRYRRSGQELLGIESFSSRATALEALHRYEREFRGNDDVEIVLLRAASKEDLMRTHGRFFTDPNLAIA